MFKTPILFMVSGETQGVALAPVETGTDSTGEGGPLAVRSGSVASWSSGIAWIDWDPRLNSGHVVAGPIGDNWYPVAESS